MWTSMQNRLSERVRLIKFLLTILPRNAHMATATTLYVPPVALHSTGAFKSALPPGDYLPYEKFAPLFQLGNASTEQYHPATKNLSQTMRKDLRAGLQQLLAVDESVIGGYRKFVGKMPELATEFVEKLESGGRIIIVGSGTSGRIAKDLAAKCAATFPERKNQVIGVIAGGDSAMVRAKEGFEDSVKNGEKALEALKAGPKDIVILLSASGSSSFNVGAGHYAANNDSKVLYFYNSEEVPDRTMELFSRLNNPVQKLLFDTGPQAIGGSTRLQAASLAEACLGVLLEYTLFASVEQASLGQKAPLQILKGLEKSGEAIQANLTAVAQFIKTEDSIINSELANTRRQRDETSMGYVTLIGLQDCFRECCVDTTEVPPTFSMPFYRREGESQQKRPPFQAYVLGQPDNIDAWQSTLGGKVNQDDLQEISRFLLSTEVDGENAYAKRPKGKGNMVIGVVKLSDTQKEIPSSIEETLEKARKEGGEVGLIVVSSFKIGAEIKPRLEFEYPSLILLEEIPQDPMGITHTLALKQVLNLISNGVMILGGNVYGNRMINVSAANNKLIDRSMREVKEIWAESYENDEIDPKTLYHFIIHNKELIKTCNAQGKYTPSVVKITLAMLYLEKTPADFDEVVRFLMERKESLSFLPADQ